MRMRQMQRKHIVVSIFLPIYCWLAPSKTKMVVFACLCLDVPVLEFKF